MSDQCNAATAREPTRRRKYELKRRAETMEQTRRRIAQATFELHTTIGVPNTTIGAIAQRAGVQRATVYRHFPDELSLFRACVAYGHSVLPAPDGDAWRSIPEPEDRIRHGLGELYRYLRSNEVALFNVLRDMGSNERFVRANEPTFAAWRRMRAALVDAWTVSGRRQRFVEAAVGHALDFQTWRQLARQEGLDDAEIVELMTALIRCAAGDGRRDGRRAVQRGATR